MVEKIEKSIYKVKAKLIVKIDYLIFQRKPGNYSIINELLTISLFQF